MPEDWFDVAYINNREAILHGKRADGSEVRQTLTLTQAEAVEALNGRHDAEMQRLLRGYAGKLEVRAAP